MASVFVSHSSRDRAVTERVVARLQAAGFAALFVDFDPEQGIPAGRTWERELYAQLRRTDAVIFLASEASVDSRWCSIEIGLARSLGRPVFPLRLQPGVQLPLLVDVQWTDLTEVESGMNRLLTGLRSAGLDPADSFAWDPARSPYPGLVPFAPEDAAVFFGRRPETHRLVELLTPTLQRGPGRMVAVVGPSGSGKSSLVHAGLLPRLARQPERWVVVPPLRPGRRPTVHLAGCLARAFAARGRPRPAEELAATLERGSAGLVALAGELADLAGNGAGRPGVLVVVDQAEELLTRTGAREQRAFLQLLGGALHEDSPVWAVATVRSEFLSTAPERAGLAEAVDDPLVIKPLSRSRLAEVIARPAQRAGLELESGLVERMVEDTVGGDALPLLGYTLHELYQRAGPGGDISVTDYEVVGGVIGALRHRADRLAAELDRRGLGDLVLPTLTRLAAVTGEEQPTRRRVRGDAFSAEERVVVDAFVDASLLVSSHDPANRGAEAVVEVAHEALLRQWSPLREAIEADRDLLRLRSELERLAADWQNGGRDGSYLLRGGRLDTIEQWAQQHLEQFGSLEREFLQASRTLATRELKATRESRRRLRRARLIAAAQALLLVIASVSFVVAVVKADSARKATASAQTAYNLAAARGLAAQADRVVGARPDLAILLGLESLSLARGQGEDPPPGLITGLAQLTHRTRALLSGHDGAVNAVAVSPDGALLATAGEDATVRLWETATGRPHGQPLTGHSGAVRSVAFSPDGALLTSASTDRTVRLWDTATGQPRGEPLTGHTGAVDAVAVSPDGALLATAGDLATPGEDGTVRLWDAATGQPHGEPLRGHGGAVNAVAFSPDGALLATAGSDRTVRLWETATGRPHGEPLEGHTGVVTAVAFSSDGTLLATAGSDRTVRLWETATGRPHGQPLTGSTGAVWAVAFSPDGTLLAGGGADGTVRLWDAATGQPHGVPLTGSTGAVTAVAFSPDGALLATGDAADGTVQVRETATGQPHGQPLEGHTGRVNAVAFSPDGVSLASAGTDGTVRLWNPDTGEPRGALVGNRSPVNAMAFSPDGASLASASNDGTVRLWDSATGRLHGEPLTGNRSPVLGVAFSSDGARLTTTGADGAVYVWDPATGKLRGELAGTGSRVVGVAFSPDGTALASAVPDATVQVWDLSWWDRRPADWAEAGCGLVTRNLSRAEWSQFVGNRSYQRTCPALPSGEDAPDDAAATEY